MKNKDTITQENIQDLTYSDIRGLIIDRLINDATKDKDWNFKDIISMQSVNKSWYNQVIKFVDEKARQAASKKDNASKSNIDIKGLPYLLLSQSQGLDKALKKSVTKILWDLLLMPGDDHKKNIIQCLPNFSSDLLEHRFLSIGTSIENANFYGAQLEKASFQKSVLKSACFSHANLKESSFSKADLPKANFSYACLEGACLFDVKGTDIQFCHANLTGATLGGSLSSEPLINPNFKYANLNGAYLDKAKWLKADLTGANLIGVRSGQYSHNEKDSRRREKWQENCSILKDSLLNAKSLRDIKIDKKTLSENGFDDSAIKKLKEKIVKDYIEFFNESTEIEEIINTVYDVVTSNKHTLRIKREYGDYGNTKSSGEVIIAGKNRLCEILKQEKDMVLSRETHDKLQVICATKTSSSASGFFSKSKDSGDELAKLVKLMPVHTSNLVK